MSLKQYGSVYATLLKNNFVREAVYRTNFIVAPLVDIAWMGIELALFGVIYANVPTIAGWTREQTYFFLGVLFASDSLFTTFFQSNFWAFSDLVAHGELDTLLTKPVHPLFIALTRRINLTAILNTLLGVLIMAMYAKPAGFEGGILWLALAGWLAIGCLTQLAVRFAFSIWVFWTDRGFALARLYFQFFAFATKPDLMYPHLIRLLIKTALPFAFIASIPTRAILQGLEPKEYFEVLAVLGAFLTFNAWMWRRGLQRYQSASS